MKKYYLASIVSLIFVPLITVVAELVAPVKNFLKDIFWHHWLGKSVVLVILYVVLVLLFSLLPEKNEQDSSHDARYLSAVTLVAFISSASVFVFFVYEYLSK